VLFYLSIPIVIFNVVEVGLVEDRLSIMIAIRVLIYNPSSLVSQLRCCLVLTKYRLTSKWVTGIVIWLSYEVTALHISWSCKILASQEQHLFVKMTNYRYFGVLRFLFNPLILLLTYRNWFAFLVIIRLLIIWILRLHLKLKLLLLKTHICCHLKTTLILGLIWIHMRCIWLITETLSLQLRMHSSRLMHLILIWNNALETVWLRGNHKSLILLWRL
jgi:hypothetical protein